MGRGQEEVSKGRETGDEIKEDRIEGRRGWGERSGEGEGGKEEVGKGGTQEIGKKGVEREGMRR